MRGQVRNMPDHRFLYQLDITSSAIHVYFYLEDRANKDGICWPAIPTMAKELKCSESTIRRALRQLRSHGLITSKQRYRKDGGKSSLEYALTRAGSKQNGGKTCE